WKRRAADGDQNDHRAVQNRERNGQQDVHRLLHAPRSRHKKERRKMGDDRADAASADRAHPVVHAHQGDELQGVREDDGVARQLVQQHHLRRRRRQHRVLACELHSASRHVVRLDSSGRRQQSKTVWGPVLSVAETPHLLNPKNGWLYNSNNWPWSAAGAYSPKQKDFPSYVDVGVESARGLHAIRVLSDKKDFTIESLRAAAYDSYLPAFAIMVPPLVKAWDDAPSSNPLKAKLAEQISVLRKWDYRWGVNSIPTSLAVFWGTELGHTNRHA